MTSPVWEFQGIPTKRPFSSWEFQLEFRRFQRRESSPREFQGPSRVCGRVECEVDVTL